MIEPKAVNKNDLKTYKTYLNYRPFWVSYQTFQFIYFELVNGTLASKCEYVFYLYIFSYYTLCSSHNYKYNNEFN